MRRVKKPGPGLRAACPHEQRTCESFYMMRENDRMKEVRRRLRAAIAQAQRNGEDLEAIQDALCSTMEKLKGFQG